VIALNSTLENILTGGVKELNLSLPTGALDSFRIYYEMLEKTGSMMNLTTIVGEEDVARFHFLDCLALLSIYSFSDKSFIDIGTGAGFPGIPLLIGEPSARGTLLDSLGKRITFLSQVSAGLERDVTLVNSRAEEYIAQDDNRESYDIALSRAVAKLNMLAELALPFVKVGGVFIAMKSSKSKEEINESSTAIDILGGKIENIAEYEIPGTEIIHNAIIVRKVSNTPDKYPRRFARIQKSPL